MATRHESLRIEETTAEAVMQLAEPNESKAAVYNRVLRAGLRALESGSDSPPEERDTERETTASESEIQTLRESITDLRGTVATLTNQLAIKDEQITALTTLTSQAQHLHALTEQKALESAEAKEERQTGGFWARLFGKD